MEGAHPVRLQPPLVSTRESRGATDDAILDAEAQLVAQVGASDEDGGHGGASDDVQLDPGLVLQTLHQESKEESQSSFSCHAL